ncbi:MAG: chromosome segregation protein SMC [Candidatus Aenigmarchaeota archaeon]|nr:chromosome segregation protein SMC [Candidatus Aenigmarchaeota archaeon]
MVTIQKITMQGFKSFKRKTAIPFPTGFSCFTGPNGAGKSNVVDAFSFVLGIRGRALRAEKTEDLIYGGSKTKDSSDYALVSMTFDNSKGLLPVEDREVVVSRKLNKQGVSTYRMNGRVVTKQHMAAILAQAQIQADGHNIIKQGDVNQVVEMDAVERRQILDELSGISEYDEKKAKAMKELEAIDVKVREAEILLNDKTNTVAKLKAERDAALAYQEMNASLEKIRASIIWKENEDTGGELEGVDRKAKAKEAEMAKLDADVAKLDAEVDGCEKEFSEMAKQVVQASDSVEESRRLVRLQGEAGRLRDKIESNDARMGQLSTMMERLRSMDERLSPAARSVRGVKGVFGTLAELLAIPREYRVAAEVAAGSHMQDIVVDTTDTAVACVNRLKEGRVGRARFIPLDRISSGRGALPAGAVGWLSDLVKFDQRFSPAVLFALGSTACVEDINKAKALARSSRTRMVTLDGDLIDSTGAVTGGFYSKKVAEEKPELGQFLKEKARLEDENAAMENRLRELNAELEKLADREKGSFRLTFEKDKIRLDEKMKAAKAKRADAYSRKLAVQQEIGRLNVQKARLEAKFENAKAQLETLEGKGKKISPKGLKPFVDMNLSKLRSEEHDTVLKLNSLGQINFRAIEEFESIRQEFDEFKQKVDKIVEEKNKILDTITKIESKRLETFSATLDDVSKHFRQVYGELTDGEASLALEVPNNISSGLRISAAPEGKKLLSLDSLSGGEKTLTAFAFLFALKKHRPSPFYILDEADATLDKANTKKVVDMLKRHSVGSQFIVISHNDHMIREADRVYGVTMNEGESKVLAIELPAAAEKKMQGNN